MSKPELILVGGPTASGKSALASEMARRENGVVVNADAMQVYAGLPLLTAQPGAEDRREIPHELYEVADASLRFSVGKWLSLAHEAISRAVNDGRTPVIVGGTGLYFKALTEGLAEIPEIPDDARDSVKRLYDELGHDAFRQKLATMDSVAAARIKPNDRQRLIRAYEVVAHTAKPLHVWQEGGGNSSPSGAVEALPPRGEGFFLSNSQQHHRKLHHHPPPLPTPAREAIRRMRQPLSGHD